MIMKKKSKVILEEVRNILGMVPSEKVFLKSPLINKKNGQVTLKLPLSVVLKSGVNKDSTFAFVFNPEKEETIKQIKQSKLVIYLKP
jgi:hypothetical protein